MPILIEVLEQTHLREAPARQIAGEPYLAIAEVFEGLRPSAAIGAGDGGDDASSRRTLREVVAEHDPLPLHAAEHGRD